MRDKSKTQVKTGVANIVKWESNAVEALKLNTPEVIHVEVQVYIYIYLSLHMYSFGAEYAILLIEKKSILK